jgi:hypothetical protein
LVDLSVLFRLAHLHVARMLAEAAAHVDERGAIVWDASSSSNMSVLQQARDKCETICKAAHVEASGPHNVTVVESRGTRALPAEAYAMSATAISFGSIVSRAGLDELMGQVSCVLETTRQAFQRVPQLQQAAVLFSRSQLSSSTPTLTVDVLALEAAPP